MKNLLCLVSIVFSLNLHAQMSSMQPLDVPEYKPAGDPTVTLDDLSLWVCGDFYLGLPVLVRSNMPIDEMYLRIEGGNLWSFGRTHEFLVVADTIGDIHEVILEYKDKRFKQGIKFVPDPIVSVKLGGQDASAGMASISVAKSTNLLEFEGEYGFNDGTDCLPKLPEIKVEGQVELTFRGVTKDRIEFGPSTSVDITRLLNIATPGSQIVVTQFNLLVDGEMVVYRSSPVYNMVVLMN